MIEADPVYGKLLGVYPSDRARLLIPPIMIVVSVGLLLNFTLATVEAWWGPTLTVFITAGVMLAAGWPVLHLWNREVILYEQGFSYREGARTVFFVYEEIRSIRQSGQQLAYFGGLIRRSTLHFTLITVREERMTLTSLYKNIDGLGARLEAKINAVLEPIIRERLAKGEKVLFSDTLRLSNSGLYEGGRELLWTAFGGYRVSGGRLALVARGDESEWFGLPLGEVDNITLLVKLLKEPMHQE
jgi:hypothetical protein